MNTDHRLSNYEDFVEFLRAELSARKEKNIKYSQRAFARDLGLRSGRLNEILNGKLGLSVAAAKDLAQKLTLATEDQARFCELVRFRHARSKKERDAAEKTLKEKKPEVSLEIRVAVKTELAEEVRSEIETFVKKISGRVAKSHERESATVLEVSIKD